MQNFQVFSRRLRCLFHFFIFLLPLLTIFYWFNVERALTLEINPFFIPQENITLNTLSYGLGLTISLIPTFIGMIMCYFLCHLFKNYENGSVFTEINASYYKKLGQTLFIFSLVQLSLPALMSLALTFQNPPGSRLLMLTIGTSQILPFIISFVVSGIAYVMKEAHRLDNEQKLTI